MCVDVSNLRIDCVPVSNLGIWGPITTHLCTEFYYNWYVCVMCFSVFCFYVQYFSFGIEHMSARIAELLEMSIVCLVY